MRQTIRNKVRLPHFSALRSALLPNRESLKKEEMIAEKNFNLLTLRKENE